MWEQQIHTFLGVGTSLASAHWERVPTHSCVRL